jgi:hypothetical protein
MPANKLLSPRQEAFAQAIAHGKPQVRAYALAGYRRQYSNASRLIRNDKVRSRISELKQENESMAQRTREEHLAKMLEREKKADDKGQLSTAHAIANDYAKLMGWLIEKREVTTKQAPADPCFDDLTELEKEQWEMICKPIIMKIYGASATMTEGGNGASY